MALWQTPKEDWVPLDGIIDTDFNRIEGNIESLHKGGGQAATVSIAAAESLAINSTDSVFIVTGDAFETISYIATGSGATARQPNNTIHLVHTGSNYIQLIDNAGTVPANYANLQICGGTLNVYPKQVVTLVYTGSSWYVTGYANR